jgi:DNA repair protein RecN (Recombination protein N)
MSRVALALKAVLAGADATPTLIFDEVDAGIGGRSADPVGRLLWRLGHDHQVICVTHLPQIAAYADGHLRIEKTERDGRTVTEITALETREDRRDELAQMLGGTTGEATRAAADALLVAAHQVQLETAAAAPASATSR